MRNFKRGVLVLVYFGLVSVQATAQASAKKITANPSPDAVESSRPPQKKFQILTIATFNLKWYGLGGTLGGTDADEKRDPKACPHQRLLEELTTGLRHGKGKLNDREGEALTLGPSAAHQ